MRAVRFTKAEVEGIRAAVTALRVSGLPHKHDKATTSVLVKLEAAEAPRVSGLSARTACGYFRGVLGKRLIEPPSGANGVWAQMQKRIAALGLTVPQCVDIATVAGAQWKGRIKAESLVRQAEALLSGGDLSTPQTTGALELDDEEL